MERNIADFESHSAAFGEKAHNSFTHEMLDMPHNLPPRGAGYQH